MKQELKSAFISRGFIGAVLLMLLCLMGYSIPSRIVSVEFGEEFRDSALHLSMGGMYFGSVILLFPFCAGLPYASSMVDEWRTGFLYQKAIRRSALNYAGRKLLAAALSGGAAAMLAFLLHAAIWNMAALPYDPVRYPYHQLNFMDTSPFNAWQAYPLAWPIYMSIAAGLGVSAMVWAAVALAVSVYVPDRLLALSVPVCLYFFWSSRLFTYLFGIKLPFPDSLFNDAGLDQMLDTLVMYGFVFAAAAAVYIAGVKRRVLCV